MSPMMTGAPIFWYFWRPFLFFLALSFSLAGCAGKIPPVVDLGADESAAISENFFSMLAEQQAGTCPVDAEVDISFSATRLLISESGIISGYLQSMSPSYFKFVGLNPLGQPQVVIASDGESFRTILVHESRDYEGSVFSKTFQQYCPDGLNPEHTHFWLIGSLPLRNPQIDSIGRDANGKDWIFFSFPDEPYRHALLFDQETRLVLEHRLLDGLGRSVLGAIYGEYRFVHETGCRLPTRVRMESRSGRSTIEIRLKDFQNDAAMDEKDFYVDHPAGFERLIVE